MQFSGFFGDKPSFFSVLFLNSILPGPYLLVVLGKTAFEPLFLASEDLMLVLLFVSFEARVIIGVVVAGRGIFVRPEQFFPQNDDFQAKVVWVDLAFVHR